MLKLRKVELLGFKSFCEKTPITFSGSGITCIVGPNGCGKSNVVDAISWVLGEQSHKMLRAERMSDCIFNGTAKRPPMGLSEVTLTLVDPELADAVAKVLAAPENHTVGAPFTVAEDSARSEDTLTMPSPMNDSSTHSPAHPPTPSLTQPRLVRGLRSPSPNLTARTSPGRSAAPRNLRCA